MNEKRLSCYDIRHQEDKQYHTGITLSFHISMLSIIVALCGGIFFCSCSNANDPIVTPNPHTPVTLVNPSATIIAPSQRIENLTALSGTVFIYGSDGMLSARQANTGMLRWTKQIGSSLCYLVAIDTIIYATCRTDQGSTVEARRSSDGSLLWAQPEGALSPIPLKVRDGVVYLGQLGGVVIALSANDGATLWTFTSEQVGPMDTFVFPLDELVAIHAAGGLVHILYISSPYAPLQAFQVSSGHQLWTAPTDTPSPDGWDADQNSVYLSTDQSTIRALSDKNGALQWKTTLDTSISGGPAVQGQLIDVVTQQGKMIELHASSGTIAWQRQIIAFQEGYTYVDLHNEGVLLSSTDRSSIEAWDGNNGNMLWQYKSSTSIYWQPQVANGILYAWHYNQMLDAIDIQKGVFLWRYQS